MLVGEFLYPVRECRREQHPETLLRRRAAPKQKSYVLDKTKVEHTVRLVQHNGLGQPEIEDVLLEIVDQATRSPDQDVHASGN